MRLWQKVVLRLFIAMAISVAFGWLIAEGSYRLIRDDQRETPQQFELVIPPGTADRVAAGETTPSIPEHLEFVAGDVLVVINEDDVSHQLGPIWVPPGSSGSLNLDNPQLYSYSCSFQPTQYLGIDVRPRATALVRFEGALAIALPTGVLLWLYTFLLFPVKKENEKDGAEEIPA